jgi:hypothetical protein
MALWHILIFINSALVLFLRAWLDAYLNLGADTLRVAQRGGGCSVTDTACDGLRDRRRGRGQQRRRRCPHRLLGAYL